MMKRLMVLVCVCLFLSPVVALAVGQTVRPQTLGSLPKATPESRQELTDTQKKLMAELEKVLPGLLKALDAVVEQPEAVIDACNWLVQQPPSGRARELHHLTPLAGLAVGQWKELEAYGTQEKLRLKAPPQKEPREQAEWLLGVCASLLVHDLDPPVNPATVAKKDQEKTKNANIEMHRRLVSTQLSLSRLRKWQATLRTSRGQTAVRVEDALTKADVALRDSLDAHGLDRAFSASVFSGVAMGSNGVRVGPPQPDSQLPETDTTIPITMLNVESRHWGWEGEHTLDFAVRTSIGFRPVTNLVTVTSAPPSDQADAGQAEPADTTAGAVAIQQNALAFSMGARVGVYSLKGVEFSLVASANVSRLTADKVVLDPNRKDAFVSTPLEPSNRTRWGGESGVEVKVYDSAIRVLHAEGGMNSPAMAFAAGIRWDSRLRARGSLDGVDLGRHPDRRFYLSLFLDAFKVFNPRQVGEAPQTLDIAFGIEYDRALHGGSHALPSTTRFIIRGNLNLLAGKDEKE